MHLRARVLPLRFPDRAAAGRALAPRLLELTEPPTVVLGIPTGGLAVAQPVAHALKAPLAPIWIRKLVSPREPDVVIGAVDLDGDVTLAVETVRAEGLSDDELAEIAWHGHDHLRRTWEATPGLDATSLLPGTTAIVIDDGIVTGLTLRAAMRWARRQFVKQVVVAVPVVDHRVWHRVACDADRAVTLEEREDGPLARSEIYEAFERPRLDDLQSLLR